MLSTGTSVNQIPVLHPKPTHPAFSSFFVATYSTAAVSISNGVCSNDFIGYGVNQMGTRPFAAIRLTVQCGKDKASNAAC
jgi:hypothetical protein